MCALTFNAIYYQIHFYLDMIAKGDLGIRAHKDATVLNTVIPVSDAGNEDVKIKSIPKTAEGQPRLRSGHTVSTFLWYWNWTQGSAQWSSVPSQNYMPRSFLFIYPSIYLCILVPGINSITSHLPGNCLRHWAKSLAQFWHCQDKKTEPPRYIEIPFLTDLLWREPSLDWDFTFCVD